MPNQILGGSLVIGTNACPRLRVAETGRVDTAIGAADDYRAALHAIQSSLDLLETACLEAPEVAPIRSFYLGLLESLPPELRSPADTWQVPPSAMLAQTGWAAAVLAVGAALTGSAVG